MRREGEGKIGRERGGNESGMTLWDEMGGVGGVGCKDVAGESYTESVGEGGSREGGKT